MTIRGGIVLAFDDAREGTQLSFDVLAPAGIKATVPLNADRVGGFALDGTTPILTWSALDTMVANGWEMTNHSYTHPADMTALTEAQQIDEIVLNRDAIDDRGWPNNGHEHFVVPAHVTNAALREVVMRYSVSCRDTTTTNFTVAIPMPQSYLKALPSRLFDTTDMQATFDMMDAAVTTGRVAFIHTHSGDTTYWGQMRDHIVANGYEADCYTMTDLFDRYEWLWTRPQPLVNARKKSARTAQGLPA